MYDEIVNYFYLMLAKRDEKLCSKTYKLRSHFFKSFFITNLLNEGSATNDGEYEYQNVKHWSKKAPGKDIFDLDKILLPINTGKMHWISAVIFMQQKRIEIFDSLPSLGSNGQRYVEALFRYLQDEHLDKKKTPLPDIKEWKLVPTKRETPRQHNGDDCGVFTCIIADLLSIDLPLTFDQSHINQVREYIALSIIRGQATSFVTDASSLLRESTTFADSTLAGCDDVPFPRDAEARVGPLVGYHYQTPALPGYLSLSLPGYPSLAAANDVAAATAATSTAPTTVPGPALRRSTRSASLAATAAITGDKTAVAANEPIEIIDDYIPDDEMPSSVFMAHLIEKIAKRTNVLYNDIENLIDDKGVTTSIWDGIKKLLTAKKKYDEMCYGCILNNLEEMYDASAATVATIDTVTTTTVKQRTSTGSGDDEEEQYIRMNRDYLTFKLAVSVVKGSTSLNISDVTGDNVLKAFVTRSNLIPKQEDAGDIFMYTIQGGRKYTSQDFRGLPLKDILRRDVRTTIITLTIQDKADSSGGAKSKASKAGVDSNMDPELAMALRVSMEEERARLERITANQNSETAGGRGNDGDGAEESKDAEMQDADNRTATGSAAAETTLTSAMDLGLSEEEALLQQALAMSMNENEPQENSGDNEGDDDGSESIHDQQQGRTEQRTGLVKKLDGDLGDYWNTNSDTKKKETTAEKKKKKKKRKRTSSTASVAANNHQRRHSRAATQGKKQYSDHNDDDDDDNDDADTARPKKKQRIHKQVYLDAVYRYLKYPKPRPLQIDFLRSEASGQILSGENKCKMSFSRYLGLIVAAIKIQTLARGYINRKAFLSLKKEEEKKRNKK